jgi:predicted nuclease of predicted toxin-antitoxin system
MQLYADEDFPLPAVEELRRQGQDVLTAQADGRQSATDPDLLARAHALGRAILTHNRRHYERLHRQGEPHSGIVSATQDMDHAALALRIHAALATVSAGRWCIRVNRPPAPGKRQSGSKMP